MGHGGYRGGDEQLDWALLLAVWGTTGEDCSSVTIRSAFGFPPGDHDFMVVGIRSADGLATLPETWLTVHIPSDVPSLLNANISLNTHDVQRVRLIFDLPLDPDSVVKQTSYRLNGRPLPAGTGIACEVITCAWVTLEIPGEAFGYFSQNVIEVEGLRSLAGDSMPHQVSAPFTSYRD